MNSLKTYVRCTECSWDGEDWDTVEVSTSKKAFPSYRDGCPECNAEVVEGRWCITCGDAPCAEGDEECTACFEVSEAAYERKFQLTQQAIRTHNDWKLAIAAGERVKASQLRNELKELLGAT